MINAKEAQRKTMLTVVGKEAMELIEKAVNYAVTFGKFSTSLDTDGLDKEVIDNIIIPELKDLGYKVEFIPAEPKPAQCPPDQWYSTDTLKISWEV